MSPTHDPIPSTDVASETRRLLAPWFRRRRFAKDTLLWHEGDTTGMLVALVQGHVKAFRTLPDGRDVSVYLFGPGDVFGFLPFLDGDPYPLSTRAVDDVEADFLLRDQLRETVRSNPEVAVALLALLGRRLREAFDRVATSSGGAVPRVAAALAALVPEGPQEGLTTIEFPVTSQEYASVLGITPESFSRSISKLVDDGVLHRLGPRRFQVLDARGLAEWVGQPAPGSRTER